MTAAPRLKGTSTLEMSLRKLIGDAAARAVQPLIREELRHLVRDEVRAALRGARELSAPTGGEWVSPREAARLLNLKATTVRQWISRGELPAQRVGRLLRIRRDDLESFVQKQNDAPLLGAASVDEQAARILGRLGK